MKKISIITVLITLLVTSCTLDDTYVGEGPIVTQEIMIDDFSAIESLGSFNVTVSKGTAQKIEVIGHANIIDRLERKVVNNKWRIELKDGNYKNLELKINIVVPTLNEAILEGSGKIEIDEFSSTENVRVGIYGSGTVSMDANEGCRNLEAVIVGSGNIRTYGPFINLEDLDIKVDGSGIFDGVAIQADRCSVNIKGSADCHVQVENQLLVRIDGSGSVYYKGAPEVDSTIAGSGQVVSSN